MESWHVVIDGDGVTTDMLKVSPGYVRKLVEAATTQWIWANVSSSPAMASLSSGVCFQPIVRLLRGKELSKQEKGGVLRGVVTGGEWPAWMEEAVPVI